MAKAGVVDADLAITKTDGTATAVPGGSVVYTIVATNNGPTDVVGGTVTDTFPAILTCTWTCSASAGSTCTAAGAGDINDSVDLLNGGTATYTATCAIDPAATGTLDNTATVSSAVNDPDAGNNSATDSDTLTPQADLGVTKSDGVASAVPGTSVVYTIVASNSGPSDVPAATVTDTFPAALTCTWTCSASAGSTCTAAGSGNISDSVSLLSGGTATYTATCAIDPAATGTLDNTATVSSAVTDPDAGNNSATDSDTLTPQADLGVTKSDGVASAVPGTSVTYTIAASNSGPSDVPAATVTDTFPATLTCTWTCSASAGSTCTAAGSGNISDAVSLLSGGTATYTATCAIDPAATGTLDNTATVSSAVTDPDAGNNSATDSDTLTPEADLMITASAVPLSVQNGSPYTITVMVTNGGPSVATGLSVASTLPAGAVFISTTGCANDPTGVPTCSLADLAPSTSTSFTIDAVAPPSDGGMDHTFTASSAATDPVPGDNTFVLTLTFAAAIPTLGGWGLIGLALMLGLLAVRRLRRVEA